MADESELRGQRIPLPKWWWQAARERIAEKNYSQKQLAELWREDWERREAAGDLDWWEDRAPKISETQVMRCVHPKAFTELDPKKRYKMWVPTLEAVTALSRVLGLRCPVFLAATEQEAFLLQAQASEYRTRSPVAVRLAREALSPETGEATPAVRSKRPSRPNAGRSKKPGEIG